MLEQLAYEEGYTEGKVDGLKTAIVLIKDMHKELWDSEDSMVTLNEAIAEIRRHLAQVYPDR